ncbi:hypothetical protein EPN87_02445 [archaeon]|nr:MAG: hypothetical protein EPN87_02445 [archaeon]
MRIVERMKSGIPGLDKLMQGGFVKNSVNLIAGMAGTGKTIFCSQFLLEGARKGEAGIYVTLEESKESILDDLSTFNWGEEFEGYAGKHILIVDAEVPTDFKELSDTVTTLIKKYNVKRLVLDSLSIASMGWKVSSMDVAKTRREAFDFMGILRKAGLTSLLITEVPEAENKLSKFGFEEFLADSVIVLHYLEYAAGGTPRSLLIRKMRRTKHGADIYPIDINDKGLALAPNK